MPPVAKPVGGVVSSRVRRREGEKRGNFNPLRLTSF